MKTFQTKNGFRVCRLISGRSNVFLVSKENKQILVDSSVQRNFKRIYKRLKKMGISKIDYLILTHSHFDHASNAGRIQTQYSAKVIIHQTEANFLSAGENPIPVGTNIITSIILRLMGNFFLLKFRYEPCVADILVNSAFQFQNFDSNISLIHTPGHTMGSMCLIIDDEIAIAGDTIFGIFKKSAFPPFAEDTALLFESWGKLLKTNCRCFLPSHGYAISRYHLKKEYHWRVNNNN